MISKKEIQQKKRKSRAEHKCPSKLKRIIEVVKTISPSLALPDRNAVFSKHKKNTLSEKLKNSQIDEFRNWYIDLLWETYDECAQGLPMDLKIELLNQAILGVFLFHQSNPQVADAEVGVETLQLNTIANALRLYENIRRVREQLQELVCFLDKHRKVQSLISGTEEVLSLENLPKLEPIYYYDKGNESIETPYYDLFGAIHGRNLNRLRACRTCRHIFWAENINSFSCSQPCRRQLISHNRRELNKEEFNRKRREIRYKEKGVPYCDKCVRPNTKCDCYLNERRKN